MPLYCPSDLLKILDLSISPKPASLRFVVFQPCSILWPVWRNVVKYSKGNLKYSTPPADSYSNATTPKTTKTAETPKTNLRTSS